MKGTVLRINRQRGFAHVTDEQGVNRFVHANAFVNPIDFDFLYEGQPVEFTPDDSGTGGNKLRGIEVRPCQTPS